MQVLYRFVIVAAMKVIAADLIADKALQRDALGSNHVKVTSTFSMALPIERPGASHTVTPVSLKKLSVSFFLFHFFFSFFIFVSVFSILLGEIQQYILEIHEHLFF